MVISLLLVYTLRSETGILPANTPSPAIGIGFIYQASRSILSFSSYAAISTLGVSYFSVVLLLNVLLTLMIVTRLFLHGRNMRGITGDPHKTSGPYSALVVMLIESCAIYSVTFLLFIVLWAVKSPAANFFIPILIQAQVRAFLTFSGRPAILDTDLLLWQ